MDRITEIADARLAYIQNAASVYISYVEGTAAADAEHARDLAAADQTAVDNYAANERTYADKVRNANIGFAADRADALSAHDAGIAGDNKGLHDREATEKKQVQDAVDDAYYNHIRRVAEYTYEDATGGTPIDVATGDAVDAAAVIDSQADRVKDLAGQRETWTGSVSLANVALVGNRAVAAEDWVLVGFERFRLPTARRSSRRG